jgi:prophage antirepressor-like protein
LKTGSALRREAGGSLRGLREESGAFSCCIRFAAHWIACDHFTGAICLGGEGRAMQMRLKRFEFGGRDVRVICGEGEVHFLADDVLAILNVGLNALGTLDSEERRVALIGSEKVDAISLAGLRELFRNVGHQKSHSFDAWLSSVVLPWIRRDDALNRAEAVLAAKRVSDEDQAAHIALNLAAPVLARKKLVLDFSDIHHPKADWVTEGALLLVGAEEEGWSEKLLTKLSREQLGEVIQSAARILSSRS